MMDKLLLAVHLLAAFGKSPEPMTIQELKGSVDDAAVLSLLFEAGYVVMDDDGRYGLNCDPAKLSLFELNGALGPYMSSDERDFAEMFAESLKDTTVAWMIELETKPITRHDIEMFRDCVRRIEQKTGEKFPSNDGIDEMMKDIV